MGATSRSFVKDLVCGVLVLDLLMHGESAERFSWIHEDQWAFILFVFGVGGLLIQQEANGNGGACWGQDEG